VQRRFTKRLRGINLLSYCDRLIKLELNTLELRRLHNDLVLCYKIVFSLIDVNFTDFSRLVHQELLEDINSNCIKQELREQGTLSSLIDW